MSKFQNGKNMKKRMQTHTGTGTGRTARERPAGKPDKSIKKGCKLFADMLL